MTGEHGHGHGHGHGRSWWGVPHRHTTADRLDPALETSRQGIRALVVSFVALLLTALAQAVLVLVTGSVALLGDTVHNAADALTAVPLGIAFVLGRRAATRRFTYGLGRAEDLAGVVVVLLIAASAALTGYQSVQRLLDPEPVRHLGVLALAGAIGFAGNELVARYRVSVGRRIGSAALVADGLHARADGFTSLAVVLGAAGVALGFPVADPLVGLGMTVAILVVLRDAATEVLGRLMDAVDPATVELAERAAAAVDGVARAEELRMRWIGHSLRAELVIAVDGRLDVERAHRIAHDVERNMVRAVPRLVAVTVHTHPEAGTGH
ncbi:cation diffusion facilitator family transporter [Saccharothrix coeruleofusca]|uniref:cation diffusion facilitator family transporter n=1 Tax=Saccharothrix coeruleofusca TaxID=33919 RepID=UPI001AE1FB14|nr:cation diffusion facilitator family transporter [Saccharothrix coeruleofusca]MBP2336180.1 cation diffusion facilitator family transporter [Saccharothrix coeruleofusca]